MFHRFLLTFRKVHGTVGIHKVPLKMYRTADISLVSWPLLWPDKQIQLIVHETQTKAYSLHIVVLFRPFFSNHPINIQESHQHDFDPHKTPSRNYAAHPVDVAFLIPAHPDFIVDFHILKVHWHTAQGLVASAGFFKQSVKHTWQKQGFSRGSFWCCRFLDIGLSVQSIYINVPISTKSQTLKKQNINFIKQSVLSPKSAFHKLDKAPETRSSQAGHRAHQ